MITGGIIFTGDGRCNCYVIVSVYAIVTAAAAAVAAVMVATPWNKYRHVTALIRIIIIILCKLLRTGLRIRARMPLMHTYVHTYLHTYTHTYILPHYHTTILLTYCHTAILPYNIYTSAFSLLLVVISQSVFCLLRFVVKWPLSTTQHAFHALSKNK